MFFVPSRSVGSENGFVMGQGVLVKQFDELLKVSKGMRFVAAYMRALVGALSVGSLVVLRVAFVTGEWIIAVPIPLLFILIFLLVNAGRGIKMRLQASRREAVTLHWMGGALGFIFTVWCVARAVMRVDVTKLWVSVGEVLLGVLSAVFFCVWRVLRDISRGGRWCRSLLWREDDRVAAGGTRRAARGRIWGEGQQCVFASLWFSVPIVEAARGNKCFSGCV